MNAAVNRVAQGMAIRRPRAKVPCKRDKNNYSNRMSVSKGCVLSLLAKQFKRQLRNLIQAGPLSTFVRVS